MNIKINDNTIVLLGTLKGPRILAAFLIIMISALALIWKSYGPLFGLSFILPMLFLGNAGKCVLDRKSNQIFFSYRKSLKLKLTVKRYPLSAIKNISPIRAPITSENDGYSIGFKIDGKWVNAINNFTLSEKRATQTIDRVKRWIQSSV